MNLRIALESLRYSARRNLFALCGLVVGVGAVVSIVSLTLIVRREAMSRMMSGGLDLLAIRKTAASTNTGARPPPIDLSLVAGLKQHVPELVRIAPLLERRTLVQVSGKDYAAHLFGVTGSFFDVHSLTNLHGRNLSDLDRFQPFVLLGHNKAESLSGGSNTASLVGTKVLLQNRVFLVIGVLAKAQIPTAANIDWNESILLPATTLAQVFPDSEITLMHAQALENADHGKVRAAILAFFHVNLEGLGLEITSAEQLISEMNRQLRLFAILLGFGGALAFVLGGTAMLNGILLTVNHRKREIGLRRALGATRSDIRSQFLWETMLLSAASGVIGTLCGAAATYFVSDVSGWTFSLPPLIVPLGVALSIIVGTIAGGIPSWQASRMDPVAAMQESH